MTGDLVLPGNPAAALGAAPRQYVDAADATKGGLASANSWSADQYFGSGSPHFDVKASPFGAFGDNGTHDDSAAIQAAIDAAAAVVRGPTNDGVGAVVFFPPGTYWCNVTLKSGVLLRGVGDSSCLVPYNPDLPCVSGPLGTLNRAGAERLFIRGRGTGVAGYPITPSVSGVTPTIRYRTSLALATALTSGTTYTSVAVSAVSIAGQTVPIGATLMLGVHGVSAQPVTVTAATALSTAVTTTIPVISFVAGATFAIATDIRAVGGFAHGIYLPMGTGSAANGALSGSYECSWRNLRIESFGNNGFHLDGGDGYQAHQLSSFDQIQIRFCLDSGFYTDGFVQNNQFTRLTCLLNKGSNISHLLYLVGAAWQTCDNNTFAHCQFESSGSYLSGNSVLNVTTATHGVYSEGTGNSYDSCWFEGNGSYNLTNASSGLFLNYTPTGQAVNKVHHCHFASHVVDIVCRRGTDNQIWFNEFRWNGLFPASKLSFLRVTDVTAGPCIGVNVRNTATAPWVYYDSGVQRGAYLMGDAPSGQWTLGTTIDNAVAGALLTLDVGNLAWRVDNTYDVGVATHRPRDVFAARNLQLAGKPITYGTAAPVAGTFVQGAIVINSAAINPGDVVGWYCSVAGTPGTWPAFATVGGIIAESQVANLTTDLALKSPLASPAFTGTVTVPPPVNATDPATKSYTDLGDSFSMPLLSGESTMPRFVINTANIAMATQRLLLTYFVARKTETISQITIDTGGTAAAATPTLCRIGIYSIDSSTFAGTLVASIANDTTLFAGASATYLRSLSASWAKVAGQTYAFGILVVSAAATPTFKGNASIAVGGGSGGTRIKPYLAGTLAAQTDLPGSFTDASVAAAGSLPAFAVMLP